MLAVALGEEGLLASRRVAVRGGFTQKLKLDETFHPACGIVDQHQDIVVGEKVFALGYYEVTVKNTGRRIGSDWIHVFTIRDGKVTSFREFTDTAQAAEAWRG